MWLGLRVPSPDELAGAFTAFGIEEPSVDEVLEVHDRPVFAVEDDATTFVLRTAHYNAALEEVKLGELSLLLGPDFVITVRHGQATPLGAMRQELETGSPVSRPLAGMFTARQAEVVEAFRRGKANKIIAYELNPRESTVKVHIRNIVKKVKATNRTEVAYKINDLFPVDFSADTASRLEH